MVLSRLRAAATARPHVLLVEEPGGTAARLTVERLARTLGWPLADTPAEADLLVLAGADAGLGRYADRVWDQLPGPRARVRVVAAHPAPGSTDDVLAALESARRSLAAPAEPDGRPTSRPPAAMPGAGGDTAGHEGHDMGGHDMGGHDTGGQDMGGMTGHDMGGMDMGGQDMGGHDMGGMTGHEGHDMGGMDMPAGLAMADRAEDRDGLMLDVLTVPWGPALPWWPAGLVVTTTLQGDVVQQAEVTALGGAEDRRAGWDATLSDLSPAAAAVVRRLDALVRLLAVAGWAGGRLGAQRVRDRLLAGEALDDAAADVRALTRRVRRSRTLARMSTGLDAAGTTVLDRYRGWLEEIDAALAGDRPADPAGADPHAALARALVGTELGNARLVVAAMDLALSAAGREVSVG